jgi:dCMP deaminase
VPTPKEQDELYMSIAINYSKLSKAVRAQVGACLVTEQGVVLGGVNGMPVGGSNVCEHSKHLPRADIIELTTKKEVIHAETNAVLKAAREGVSCMNSTVYVTLSPCVTCSAMLINAGIKKLIYKDEYRDSSGIQLLHQHGITVEKY